MLPPVVSLLSLLVLAVNLAKPLTINVGELIPHHLGHQDDGKPRQHEGQLLVAALFGDALDMRCGEERAGVGRAH